MFTVLSAVFTAAVAIVGVYVASIRRDDKMASQIVALKEALSKEAQSRKAAHEAVMATLNAVESRVAKLREWQIFERGKSERSDVRAIPPNPGDTRG